MNKLIFVLFFVIALGASVINCVDDVESLSSSLDSAASLSSATSNSDYSGDKENYDEDEVPFTGLVLEHEILEQADQPLSGERFVAVHIKKAGAKEEINPNLVGLKNLAIKFLPNDIRLNNIISAQREVVAGVLYSIYVNATKLIDQEPKEEMVCELLIMEKPWIVNTWGDKQTILRYSNCSSELSVENGGSIGDGGGAITNPEDNVNVNQLNDFNFNPLFLKKTSPLTDSFLKEIEAQIVRPKIKGITATIITTTTTLVPPLLIPLATIETITSTDKSTTETTPCTSTTSSSSTSTVQTVTTKTATATGDNNLSDPLKNYLDDFFSVDVKSLVNNEPIQKLENSPKINQTPIGNDEQTIIITTDGNILPLITTATEEGDKEFVKEDVFIITTPTKEEITSITTVTTDLPLDQQNLLTTIQNKENSFLDDKSTTDINNNNNNNGIVETLLPLKNPETLSTTEQQPISQQPPKQQPQKQEAEEEKEQHLRKKRQSSITTTESEYNLKIATEAIQQLDRIDADDHQRIVIKIVKLKKFDAATEAIYRMVVQIANTECMEKDFSSTRDDCLKQIINNTRKLCSLEVHVKRDTSKLAHSNCSPDESGHDHAAHRARRSGRVGGPKQLSKDDPKVRIMVEQALTALAGSENGASYSLSEIESATEQVVSGKRYRIRGTYTSNSNPTRKCEMDIWSRPWISKQLVTFTCDDPTIVHNFQVNYTTTEESSTSEKRVRRQTGAGRLIGAPVEAEIDKVVEDMVKNALVTLSSLSSSSGVESSSSNDESNTYTLKKINSVTTQVVAGVKYEINGKFSSKKNPSHNCLMSIWSRPWLDNNEVTFTCDKDAPNEVKHQFQVANKKNESIKRKKRSLVGAPSELQDHEEVRPLIENALITLAGEPNGATYSLKSIENATKQVVAGILYKIHAIFSSENNPNHSCDISIWHRPWLENDEITITCSNNGVDDESIDHKFNVPNPHANRTKRSLLFNERENEDGLPYKTVSELHEERLFGEFIRKYKRGYSSERERQIKFEIFRSNLFKIEQLNLHEQGTAKYGVNDFADMTTEEFKQHRTGLLPRNRNIVDSNDIGNGLADIPDVPVPKEFDWRDKNVVTAVKNQGNCGSCWAFSVTGNIESLHAIKTGQLEEYSEQELVDCDLEDKGCNGGLPDLAYKAIEKLGGLELESEYPYHAKNEQCHFNNSKIHVRVSGAVDLPPNETKMAQWLVTNGPLSIGLNANAMQFYKGGVSHPWRPLCMHSNIDHGVLIVGLGVAEYPLFNKTLPYWIVKNSWGPLWGERGYYRVYRGDNTCGINSMVSSAVLED